MRNIKDHFLIINSFGLTNLTSNFFASHLAWLLQSLNLFSAKLFAYFRITNTTQQKSIVTVNHSDKSNMRWVLAFVYFRFLRIKFLFAFSSFWTHYSCPVIFFEFLAFFLLWSRIKIVTSNNRIFSFNKFFTNFASYKTSCTSD